MTITQNAHLEVALCGSRLAFEYLEICQMTCSMAAVDFHPVTKEVDARVDHGILAAMCGFKLSAAQGEKKFLVCQDRDVVVQQHCQWQHLPHILTIS